MSDRAEELEALIRRHCLACCCGSRAEVRRCMAKTCTLWPMRDLTAQGKTDRTTTKEKKHDQNLYRRQRHYARQC